jgi:hypothetical protein
VTTICPIVQNLDRPIVRLYKESSDESDKRSASESYESDKFGRIGRATSPINAQSVSRTWTRDHA